MLTIHKIHKKPDRFAHEIQITCPRGEGTRVRVHLATWSGLYVRVEASVDLVAVVGADTLTEAERALAVARSIVPAAVSLVAESLRSTGAATPTSRLGISAAELQDDIDALVGLVEALKEAEPSALVAIAVVRVDGDVKGSSVMQKRSRRRR